ncbi:MAG: hypothetical protein ABIP94_19885 [Planctomycetota bacterium]
MVLGVQQVQMHVVLRETLVQADLDSPPGQDQLQGHAIGDEVRQNRSAALQGANR